MAGPKNNRPVDYQGMLTGDPWYMAQNNLYAAQGQSDAAQRTQAVQQALIRFGQVPDFGAMFGAGPGGTPGTLAPATPPRPTAPPRPNNQAPNSMYAFNQWGAAMRKYNEDAAAWQKQYGPQVQATKAGTNPWQTDVTDLIRQAAQQNTGAGLSQVAMLAKANTDAQRNIKNQLAARGILRSGETGYQLGEQSLRNQQAEYQARNELLDYLQGIYSAYAQSEQQRQAARLGSLQDAYGRQASRLPAGFTPTLTGF